jgi:uncharacterized protein
MHALALALLIAHGSSAAPVDDARGRFEQLSTQTLAAFDSARGGFVAKNGIPAESAVELALRRAQNGDPIWLARATTTIGWTRGLLDTVGGGYITSLNARNPEAEGLDKRADVNARRLENLIQAYQQTGDERYRGDAARVVDWFERVLLDGRGGFVAAQVGDRELQPDANGVAIHAWLRWAALTRDSRRRDFALKSLDRVWETCWTSQYGLLRRNSFGEVDHEPQLTDQVEMGRAFLLAARLCGRPADRERAATLGTLVLVRFQESDRGGFRTQSAPKKNGSIQKAPKSPAQNARAALFLAELAELTGDARFREAALRAAACFQKEMEKMSLDAADWALASRACFEPDRPRPPDWMAEAREEQEKPRPRVVRFRNVHR